jgi:hypothetical protein
MTEVWVFTGERGKQATNATFPGGVFSSQDLAEEWIGSHKLSGVLTLYRLNVGAYDFAVKDGHFKPSKPHHFTPEFIGCFSGGDIHFHYIGGLKEGTK